MIKVFKLRGQSKLATGIDGPFDTEEISSYFKDYPKATIVACAVLDEVTLFVVVNEPDKR